MAAEARPRGGEVHDRRAPARTPRQTSHAIFEAAIEAYGGVDSVFVASGYNEPDADRRHVARAVGDGDGCQRASALADRQVLRRPRHATRRAAARCCWSRRSAGRFGSPAGYTAYCTSKGATDALTRTLASEWGTRGINVNAIAPTVFRSALTEWIFEDTEAGRASRERNLSRIPMKRLGEPEDFVGAAIYLLSSASDFVTGQILYVDGGYSAS